MKREANLTIVVTIFIKNIPEVVYMLQLAMHFKDHSRFLGLLYVKAGEFLGDL